MTAVSDTHREKGTPLFAISLRKMVSVLGATLTATSAAALPATAAAHQTHHPARHHHHVSSGIPQHDGGDHDGDNNGGPSDGDGNV